MFPDDDTLIARYGARVFSRALVLARSDVHDAKRAGQLLKATVADQRRGVKYAVTISGDYQRLACTCPLGGGCEHAVATLLYCRNHEISAAPEPGSQSRSEPGSQSLREAAGESLPEQSVAANPAADASWRRALRAAQSAAARHQLAASEAAANTPAPNRNRVAAASRRKPPAPAPVSAPAPTTGEEATSATPNETLTEASAHWRERLDSVFAQAAVEPRQPGKTEQLGLCITGRGTLIPVRRRLGEDWTRERASWREIMQERWESVTADIDPQQLAVVRGIGRVVARTSTRSEGYDALLQHALRSGITLLVEDTGLRHEMHELHLAGKLANIHFDLRQNPEQIVLTPIITIGERVVQTQHLGTIGMSFVFDRATRELAVWAPDALARAQALRFPQLELPAAQAATFVREYLPRLQRLGKVTSSDDSFTFPQHEEGIDLVIQATTVGTARIEVEPIIDNGYERYLDADPQPHTRAQLRRVREKMGRLLGIPPHTTEVSLDQVYQAADELAGLFRDDPSVRLRLEIPNSARAAGLQFDFDLEPEEKDTNWFAVSAKLVLQGEEFAPEQWREILQNGGILHVAGKRYYVDRELRERLQKLIERSENADGRLRVGIDNLEEYTGALGGGVKVNVRGKHAWNAACSDFLNSIPAVVPPAQIHLREYQEAGVRWLNTVITARCGGILADEMGLGKTVQVLAAIASTKQAQAPQEAPVLIVAPTSVVAVWLEQIRRFYPQLSAKAITSRNDSWDTSQDVLIASYGIVRSQIDLIRLLHWRGLILDEAQTVKNPTTRIHQALSQLQRQWCLAVTGTPIENSVTDLWSIMRLVNPRQLPARKRFEQLAASNLQAVDDLVGPLILRRTKQEVAIDLPEKTEQTIPVLLEPAHASLYRALAQDQVQKLKDYLANPQAHRVSVLAALTKLRRACLDARLVDSKLRIPSAKTQLLIDAIEKLAGHQILVFSQFTSYLRLIRSDLAQAGITSVYLDGSTHNRQEVVSAFRQGQAQVFLISLKAGGTGLTLVEADYVFIMDPWWNPAVENQAIDRAHRIGQTQPVTVYRLVSEGTIEEKVLELQSGKRELFSSVMAGERLSDSALRSVITALQ